ncbi:immunity 22 family protein [Chryseobacterium salviniae]|uniref:Immunity 22 family protein n=1 Tax=Chryseobacterium salviniae TaxID=3101750 RepID=A0ABU6HR05_9FLAO|nr:immunity 22 family protein [Chryseobacterium sp. T9W2-O]MEC3875492.1 immunity 22 family protein [Chryseobacterium sp. T9W2-O]
MSTLHIWLGNFTSEKDFEKYLDQEEYLKAWAVYDNEPSTGNEEEDAEPSPELRCDFCKEVDLDTYDEDFMIMKFYKKEAIITQVSDDILVDNTLFEDLCRKHKIKTFNAVIAYEDHSLTEKNASSSKTVTYIGKLPQITNDDESDAEIHYLWIGENKLEKKDIPKQAGISREDFVQLNYYYTPKSGRLDEILILQVEDYNVAEKMILKAEELKLTTTHSILDLIVKGNKKIDAEKIGNFLGMKYIGRFGSE